MFNKEKLTEIRTMIKQEVKRRNGYGSELISSLANDSLDPPSPSSGEIIKVAHGKGIVDPLVSIKEFGDIKELVAVGVPIPDDFNEDKIYTYVNELRAEPMTGNHSSCRGACTGLCVGTCGGECNGCSSTCQGGCQSGCSTSCTNTAKI